MKPFYPLMKSIVSLVFLLFPSSFVHSQTETETFWQDSLRVYERQLKNLGDSLLDSRSVFVRQKSAKDIISTLRRTLRIPGSYDYPFDSVRYMSKLRPEDDKFRLFCWVLRISRGNYRYFGVIHVNDPKRFVYHPLFDRSVNERPTIGDEIGPNDGLVDSVFTNKNWFGMLYYSIRMVEEKRFFGLKKKTYYTLLAKDLNNDISHKKIVDLLYFEQGTPVFGAPIFRFGNKMQSRVVLEYSAQATSTLHVHESDQVISFDRLMAPKAKNEKDKFTHIPSGIYDYIKWENGEWVFYKDLFANYTKKVKDANN